MKSEFSLVFGAGVSGIAAAKFLRIKLKKNVILYDQKPLSNQNTTELTAHNIKIIDQLEQSLHPKEIIVSPGVPLWHPFLIEAKKNNIPIISEISLALNNYHGKIIAVTGTNGKSTTVSMISHLLKSMGIENTLSGNIGTPPTKILLESKIQQCLVLELSSYQLETTENLKADVAIITNFTEDHLFRHKTMQEYFRCKWKIIDGIKMDSLLMIDETTLSSQKKYGHSLPKCHLALYPSDFDQSIFCTEKTGIIEKHNLINAFFAAHGVAHFCNKNVEEVIQHFKTFKGLEHRCERFINKEDKIFINDSKATNVSSTLVALDSMEDQCLLMLGGQGKGENFTPITLYKDKIKKIVAFGQSGQQICNELQSHFQIEFHPTLKAALNDSNSIYDKNNRIVLFSPACASFDEFNNFEERGKFFKNTVQSKL